MTNKKNFDALVVGEWYLTKTGQLLHYTQAVADDTSTSRNDLVVHIEPPTIVHKKRKVIKEIVRYANIYGAADNLQGSLHATAKHAIDSALSHAIAKGVELRGTYEVEE